MSVLDFSSNFFVSSIFRIMYCSRTFFLKSRSRERHCYQSEKGFPTKNYQFVSNFFNFFFLVFHLIKAFVLFLFISALVSETIHIKNEQCPRRSGEHLNLLCKDQNNAIKNIRNNPIRVLFLDVQIKQNTSAKFDWKYPKHLLQRSFLIFNFFRNFLLLFTIIIST